MNVVALIAGNASGTEVCSVYLLEPDRANLGAQPPRSSLRPTILLSTL